MELNVVVWSDSNIALVVGTILITFLTIVVILVVILYSKAQLKFELERQQLKEALLEAEIEIKEQTVTNVSRELHDNFGQIASLIKINLNMVSGNLGPEDKHKVSESLDLIRKLIGDIKELSASLNGDQIKEKGWLAVLEVETERINRTGIVKVWYEQGQVRALPHEKQLILFRIIQELLNNSLKHADSANIQLLISSKADQTQINYRDDGAGFDINQVKMGSGISNIRERCQLIDADLELHSQRGQGTQVQITLAT